MKRTFVGIIKNVRNSPSSNMNTSKPHTACATSENPIIIYFGRVIKNLPLEAFMK